MNTNNNNQAAATQTAQVKRNLNDIHQNMNKYSDLLSNILNLNGEYKLQFKNYFIIKN